MSDQKTFHLTTKDAGQVECLGKYFASDEERRSHFLVLLGQKLKDPAFRKVAGFPLASEKAILELSDPPFFTACPNPWLGDFVKHYGKPYDPKKPFHRDPFAADVSEGKNHPIYNAHSYHTKVPHRAIMRYILHYTEPGQVVLDSFCGTGMTGVAAQLCGDRSEVQSLGYRVLDDGTILNEEGKAFSKLGVRRAVLNDLSPAAAFIAYNYNTQVDADCFEQEAHRILKAAEAEIGWIYETDEPKARTKATVNYTVWSDVFSCPSCQKDVIFLNAAVNDDGDISAASFRCQACNAEMSKATAEKRIERVVGHHGTLVDRIKKVPVIVNYSGTNGRHEKPFGEFDRKILAKIDGTPIPATAPSAALDKESEQYKRDALHLRGMETVADFYTRRNLIALSVLWDKAREANTYKHPLLLWLTSIQWLASNMYRYREGGGGGQQGKLTIPSLIREQNVFRLAAEKIKDISAVFRLARKSQDKNGISIGDAATIGGDSLQNIDYIFIDPPFGGNIFYSDLNCIWEGWLRVTTNDDTEAVVHRVQTDRRKDLNDYSRLMFGGLHYAFQALKPGRWITIEFSNSQASVWNAIQTTLQEAGFVIANVAALDKQQRSFRSVTATTAVKQDLVISAYKPNGGLEDRFARTGATVAGVWDFVNTHLRNLPVVKANGGQLEPIVERDPRILYDRMVAFYIGHSIPVPLSSGEFQIALQERFPERDGMVFLAEQVAEYDKKRAQMECGGQLSIFVEDEKSAINWLRKFLKDRPSTYQDIQPEFMKQLSASWKKFESRPELMVLLEQNFLQYRGSEPVPSQIHNYLSTNFKDLRGLAKEDVSLKSKAKERWYVPDPRKAADVDMLRDKRLLEEFWGYLPEGYTPANIGDAQASLPGIVNRVAPKAGKKKYKEVRTEAIRVGFKHCYQLKDYQTILVVGQQLPEDIIQEDEQLQMIHDMAAMRSEA